MVLMIVPVSKQRCQLSDNDTAEASQRGWLRPTVATTDCDLDVVLAVKQAYALGVLGACIALFAAGSGVLNLGNWELEFFKLVKLD